MIRAIFIPSAFRPSEGREVCDVAFREGMTVREAAGVWLAADTGADDAPAFVATADSTPIGLDDPIEDGCHLVITRAATGVVEVGYVVASLIVSAVTGLLAQALLPGLGPVEDPRENAPTYGFDGQIRSSRRDGAPIALAYGRMRAGGQIIAEFVENGRGSATSSVYAVQIAFGDGPIRSIGGLNVPTDAGTVLRSDIDTQGFLDGILIDGNDARALSGVEAQVRLGTDEQATALGYELVGTPTPNGGVMDAPATGAPATTAANIDPISTTQVDQDAYWDEYGKAVVLPSGTYDVARVTVSFPQGAFIVVGSAIGQVHLNLIVRYIELDEFGAEITTGGNFGDGWVRMPFELYSYQTQSRISTDFVFPFYDPASYTPPTQGGAIFFPADSTAPTPDLRIDEANVTKPAAWASGNDVTALTVELWLKITTLDNGTGTNPGTQHMLAGLYEFETHGWSLSIEEKEFQLAPGQSVLRWVPTLRKHQGSTVVDYHENYVAGGTSDGIGDPTFTIEPGEWVHLAVTYEGEWQPGLDRIRFYANGSLIEDLILDAGLDHADYDFAVGRFEEEGIAINAEIDELVVYDRVLNEQDVWQSYNFGQGLHHEVDSSMVFAYHFNGVATDFSGNDNDLTGSAGVTYTVSTVVRRPSGNVLKPGRYRVEVAKNNSKTTNVSARDVPNLDSVTGLVDGSYSYGGTAVLSLKVQATEELNSNAPNITAPLEGRLVPIWDGDSAENPTFFKAYSRNPAWVVADIALAPNIALGNEIGPTKIDVISFQVFADFCDEWLTDGRGDFRESTNDGDADGWTDLRYSATTVDSVTGQVRGSISIRFASFADIPDHWRVGEGVRFDGTPAVGGNMNLDISYPNMDGFEIYLINESDSLPFVNVYYDRLGQGEPWTGTGGSLASAIGGGNLTGTIEGAVKRFTFDAFIDTARKGWDLINEILSNCRAAPNHNGDTLRIKIRRDRNVSGFVGMGNIEEGSFEVNYVDTKTTGNEITVRFKDEALDFEESTQPYLHSSGDPASLSAIVSQDVDGFGIVRRIQALRHAAYIAKINREVKRHGRFRVLPDGLNFEVADLLAVSHDLVPWGKSGRVLEAASAGTTTIKFDREIQLRSGETAFVRVRNEANSRLRVVEISQAAGTYVAGTPITLDASIPFDITRETIYTVYHEGEEVLIDITALNLDGRNGAEVQWVEYVESVYEDDPDALAQIDLNPSQTTAELRQAQSLIPANVENLLVREVAPDGNSEDDAPRLFVSWQRPTGTRPAGGYVIWGATASEAPVALLEVRGDTQSAEVSIPLARAGAVYRIHVQQIAADGTRRRPETCASRAVRVARLGAAPDPPTNFTVAFAEDTATYLWELPADAPSLVVEARAGGWSLGRKVFTSGRGDRSFGPTTDWSAGRITLRSMNAAGRYSEPVIIDLDTSDVQRDADATDVDPLLGGIEWADYEDGWIDDSSHSSPKPVMVDLARDADGFLSFDGSSLTASYTTSDPTTALDFARTSRELYLEANCLAFQQSPAVSGALPLPPNDPRVAPLTGDGFAHSRNDLAAGVTLKVEARIAIDGTGWTAWRDFHPGLVQAVAVQFRLTITRPSADYDVQIRSLYTSVASKLPSLYDITPEDLFLRNELESYG